MAHSKATDYALGFSSLKGLPFVSSPYMQHLSASYPLCIPGF